MDTPAKVLVVEDHPDFRNALTRFLGHHGYTVVVAATLAEGMAKLDGQAVAVLDYNLPDGVGTELLARIRREGRPIRVAMVSASHESDLDAMRAAGADAVFAKPLDMRVLLDWIAAAVADATTVDDGNGPR